MEGTRKALSLKHKTPPLFTTLRVNTRVVSVGEAKCKLQQLLEEQYKSRKETVPVATEHPVLPDVLVIPGRGPILREMCEKAVIVDKACGCAVLRGAHVFTQGIMAAPGNMQAGDLVSVYADVEGSCRMGLTKTYTGKTVHVGNGTAKHSRSDIFVTSEKPSGVGIEMTHPIFDAPSLSGVLPDLLFAQNLPSAVVSHVLAPLPGHCVLDMCAAPGGKTVHIATLMNNQGRLIAFDKSAGKVAKIKENCTAWGITMAETYVYDASRCVAGEAVVEGVPPYPEEMFDRVLLDGPCSALGQRPMLACKMTRRQLTSHPVLQKSLFSQAVKALKPGGSLVYSTCTITTAENEEIVAWALRAYPSLELVKQTPCLGGPGIQVDGLSVDHAKLVQRFGPACLISVENQTTILNDIINNESSMCHGDEQFWTVNNEQGCEGVDQDTIGFFIAKFVKS